MPEKYVYKNHGSLVLLGSETSKFSKNVVALVSRIFQNTLGRFCPTKIACVCTYGSEGHIENTTLANQNNPKILVKYREIYKTKNSPCAIAQCKIDVSEIDLPELGEALRSIEKQLHAIDHTRDFAGTIVPEKLENHLRSKGVQLEDRACTGRNCFSWQAGSYYGTSSRRKVCNKVVSNFEAGDVRKKFGTYLADVSSCRNARLQKTLEKPLVTRARCTRIEVSIRNPDVHKIRSEVHVVDAIAKRLDEPVFCKQSIMTQWSRFAERLDRQIVVIDISDKKIYVGWYANTQTLLSQDECKFIVKITLFVKG